MHEAHEPEPCSECYAEITETLDLTERLLRTLKFKTDVTTGTELGNLNIQIRQVEEEIEYLKEMQGLYDDA